jgi:hypothetical protein
MLKPSSRIYILAIVILLFSTFHNLVGAEELSLGDVKIGDRYSKVLKTYPNFQPFSKLEEVSPPYPMNVLYYEPVKIAESKKHSIVVYLDPFTQNVRAIVTFLSERDDASKYETGAGLRVNDNILAAKLLYGEPEKTSPYTYFLPGEKANNGGKVTDKIYYYKGFTLHTREMKNEELVISIVIGEYDVEETLIAMYKPIPKNRKFRIKRRKKVAAKKKKRKVLKRIGTVKVEAGTLMSYPKRPTDDATTQIAMGEKVEVAEKMPKIKEEFLELINTPEWQGKIMYNRKTKLLSITYKMSRKDLKVLKESEHGKGIADDLERLYLQFFN